MKLSTSCLGKHFKLLIVGAGAGGMGASHKFGRLLPAGSVAMVDPIEAHYYQPGFTLVGGGLMSLEANKRNQKDLIHPKTKWIKDSVVEFNPKENTVKLSDGQDITYDFMLIATGVVPRFDTIKGLKDAMDTPGVCSNYSPKYCEKTYREIQNFKSGNAIFTFPNAPIKCAGGPQKICYIADSQFRKMGKRQNAEIYYTTTLGQLFGIDKYCRALEKVAAAKGIHVKTRTNLIAVNSDRKMVTFEKIDNNCGSTGETFDMEYSLLHIGPPCSPIQPLIEAQPLTDAKGFVDVDVKTLQSKAFSNVFAVGDCMNTPNAKTAAAVSSHLKTVEKNLMLAMEGKKLTQEYDGYASCPLVVDLNKVILAEFNSNGPMETMPFDQSRPKFITYLMKRYGMPFLYWHGLVKGYWNGPATMRKILHLGNVPKN